MKPHEETWRAPFGRDVYTDAPGYSSPVATVARPGDADARLIAAAPEMARMLLDMCFLDGRGCRSCGEVGAHYGECDAVAVLRKAGVLP